MTTTIKPATEVQLLLDARAQIEKYGWTQEVYGNKSTGFCAVGALRAVDHLTGPNEALRLLARAVKADHCQCGEHGRDYDEGIVVEWNDDESRTEEEVLAAYDRAVALGLGVAR